MKTTVLWASLFFVTFISCSKKDSSPRTNTMEPTEFVGKYLVEDAPIKTLSIAVLEVLSNSFFENAPTVHYQVMGHKLKYRTLFQGKSITASGIVLLPETEQAVPVVAFQHGTLTQLENTPSLMTSGLNEVTLGALLASRGYVVIMSDYIGYGDSATLPHPYDLQEGLGPTTLDCILAGFEFFEKKAIPHTSKLFVTGYSEGGYASMALLKALQESSNLKVSHAFLGAGAYNKTASLKTIVQQTEPSPYLRYYLWVLHTYNNYYDNLKHSWSTYVVAPYDAQLNEVTDWRTVQFDEGFPQKIQELFTVEFLQQVQEGNDNTPLIKAFSANDLFDWNANTPITFYHGTKDTFVPPINSQSAFEALRARGNPVNYIPLEGKNHQTAIFPFVKAVLAQLDELR